LTTGTRDRELRNNCIVSFSCYFQFNYKIILFISSQNGPFYTKQTFLKNPSSICILIRRRYLTPRYFSSGHLGKSHMHFTYKVFINRKVVMNPSFDHLSVQINLLFRYPRRFSLIILSKISFGLSHLNLDQRK
jgi:hypothetical protein